jgi:hypothetical protein
MFPEYGRIFPEHGRMFPEYGRMFPEYALSGRRVLPFMQALDQRAFHREEPTDANTKRNEKIAHFKRDKEVRDIHDLFHVRIMLFK